MTRPIVELTQYNVFMSAQVGISRQVKSMFAGHSSVNGHDSTKRGWQDACDGAIGEQALAKYLNVYWDGSPGIFRNQPDVGDYEVRANAASWGDLILRDRDSDTGIYVLVLTHNCPKMEIRGWMLGRDCKQDKWWRVGDRNRPPAWFVPQDELHDMSTLPKATECTP